MAARPSVAEDVVVGAVCAWFSNCPGLDMQVTLRRLQAGRRGYPFSEARHTLIWLLSEYGYTTAEIARLLDVTHATVSTQRSAFAHFSSYDLEAKWDLESLRRKIDERRSNDGDGDFRATARRQS